MFKGEKVCLTAMRAEDLPDYRKWNGEAGFGRNYNSSPIREISEKQANDWFQENTERDFRFAIRPVGLDTFMGVCAIEDIEWPHRVGWLSIALGPDFQGHGYGTEAMAILMNYAWNELNLHRLQLTVFDYNQPAIAMYERLGFQKEGVYREFLQRDGKRHDMFLYGKLTSESSDF
ncbi:GNAT family protein [Planococcus shenhongbingii]|uniref:GNAT family protein n=1 Tax=Planococcus shenhongbingii TaxID=3058398 RepID=A0ABT8NAY6_9BACL|nr:MULTISPECIES: GNAT family protein [unclassified Planococcus (in: firmicutes)]MDN7245053.1 GNAT family protein [Planococcus sp. N017]WKA58148.1 GNAT family protein [Planococcus sp. N016]